MRATCEWRAMVAGLGAALVIGMALAQVAEVATAHHASGVFHPSTTSTFTVLGTNTITETYDGAGYVTNRVFADGRTQVLTWDALGRLARVIEKQGAATNYLWRATYDGLGRRVRSEYWPRGTNGTDAVTVGSWFDPEVEFLEVAVEVNGLRTWKVHGPDLSGSYGGMQGAGGTELTVCETNGAVVGVLNDFHGNTLATINPSPCAVNWVAARVNGYGPVSGYRAPVLAPGINVAECGVWRGERIEPTGFYWLGARHYDPVAGRFLSPDPMGHSASRGLYDFCNGDPVNHFDADGRMWKSPLAGYESSMADLRYANSASGQFMQAYHQTQADMQRMRTFSYDEPSGSGLSSLLNLTPVVGTFKMWTEMNTGKDMVTGQWHHQSPFQSFLGASLNAVGSASLFSGVFRQGAYNASVRSSSFSSSFASWEMRSATWAGKLPACTWGGGMATSKSAQGVSVLGTYAPFNGKTYYQLAQEIGARRFYLPGDKFAKMVQRAESVYGDAHHYNKLYLDAIVKRQDVVRLNISRPEMKAIVDSNPNAFPTLRWEIDDLLKRGYRWGDDLKSLIPRPKPTP